MVIKAIINFDQKFLNGIISLSRLFLRDEKFESYLISKLDHLFYFCKG